MPAEQAAHELAAEWFGMDHCNTATVKVWDAESAEAKLGNVWEAIDTPVYRVVDENGVNVGRARCRRLTGKLWLHVEIGKGLEILGEDDLGDKTLIAEEDHTPLRYNQDGEVVRVK